MFKIFKITLNRVRDRIVIREGDDELPLTVDSDARTIMARLQKANKALSQINDDVTDEQRYNAAYGLAEAIFGKEQADKLMAFYNDDPRCVVTVCGIYFEKRLGKKITAAQKR